MLVRAVVMSGKDAVKGLLFNLLDQMARDAGCSDAVWSLVADFAAAETRLVGTPGGSLRPGPAASHMALSARALVHCFAQQADAESLVLDFEPDGDWAFSDDAEGSADDLTVLPEGGFHRHAFAQIDWERLDGLPDDDE